MKERESAGKRWREDRGRAGQGPRQGIIVRDMYIALISSFQRRYAHHQNRPNIYYLNFPPKKTKIQRGNW